MIYNKETIEKVFELLDKVAKKAHNEAKTFEAPYNKVLKIGTFTDNSIGSYPIKLDLGKDFLPRDGYGSQWKLKNLKDIRSIEIDDDFEEKIAKRIKEIKEKENECIAEGVLTIRKLEEYISS